VIATAERLTYRYPGAAGDVLADVGLELRRGEVVVLAGPSGGGKTTLLRAFAGLVPHFHGGRFAGHVRVDGLDTRDAPPAAVARRAGIAFQDPEAQVVYRSVLRDVAFGLANHGVPAGELEVRSRAALGRVGALALAGRTVDTLSGGELQRVALAGVLAPEPPVLLLDEPTAQLDDAGAATFLALLRGLADEGTAVLIAEHRRDRVDPIADRVIDVGGEARAELPPSGPEPAGGDVVLAARGLTGGRGGRRVLAGIDLDVRVGQVCAIHGPNGSGKSTLVRVLAGLDRAAGGSIALRGSDVTALAAEDRYPELVLVPQDPGRFLLRDSVAGEVRSGARHAAAGEALAALDLTALADRHPRDLSAGERERVAIAAALAADPAVLVLDEPTRGMDPVRRAALAHLLRARAASGRAVVLTTHDRRFAAACGAVAHELRDGRLETAA
jgi:energy-coupling factor transport system ATP-binding protein